MEQITIKLGKIEKADRELCEAALEYAQTGNRDAVLRAADRFAAAVAEVSKPQKELA